MSTPVGYWRVAKVVGVALGMVVVAHGVVETAGLRFFQPSADESIRVLERFRVSDGRANVVLLGSSRMRRAVVSSVFADALSESIGERVSAFNLGIQGGTMPAYYLIVRDLLRGPKQPDLVVLGLGVRSMNSHSPRHARVLHHLASPLDLFGPMHPQLRAGGEWLAVPMLMFRAPGSLLQLIPSWRGDDPGTLSDEVDGSVYDAQPTAIPLSANEATLAAWVSADRLREHLDAQTERTQKRAAYTRRVLLRDFATTGRASWALTEMLGICRQRGMAVVVVNLPVSDAFRQATYRHGEYQGYLRFLGRVGEREDVTFLDLNNEPFAPNSYFFEDGDHLSAEGAYGFSRLLAQQVVPPLGLRRRSSSGSHRPIPSHGL